MSAQNVSSIFGHLWEYGNRYNFYQKCQFGNLYAQSKMVNMIYVALLMLNERPECQMVFLAIFIQVNKLFQESENVQKAKNQEYVLGHHQKHHQEMLNRLFQLINYIVNKIRAGCSSICGLVLLKSKTNFLLGLITSTPVRSLMEYILYYYIQCESLYFCPLNIF